MEVLKQQLSTGYISVKSMASNWKVDDLFAFAERHNPKRSFLFVSKVLGRHMPVLPSKMRQTYKELANQFPTDIEYPLLFIGMAETAVGLAAGVFEEAIKVHSESVLLTTTRHPVEGELLCEFKEEHSHATDHLLYWPQGDVAIQRVKQAKTLVLIDDETTTGNTLKNLIFALRDAGLSSFEQVVTVILTDWTQDVLSQLVSLPVTQIALMKGNWEWEKIENAPLPIMPNVNITARGEAKVSLCQNWGRLGVTEVIQNDWINQFKAKINERILVLGTGEFVYVPFLVAERLEQQGAKAFYSSTSRSPIADGLAIESSLSFTDNYGLNIPNYCYNIAHQKFDRIILCIETLESNIDSKFLTSLSSIADIVEIAEYA